MLNASEPNTRTAEAPVERPPFPVARGLAKNLRSPPPPPLLPELPLPGADGSSPCCWCWCSRPPLPVLLATEAPLSELPFLHRGVAYSSSSSLSNTVSVAGSSLPGRLVLRGLEIIGAAPTPPGPASVPWWWSTTPSSRTVPRATGCSCCISKATWWPRLRLPANLFSTSRRRIASDSAFVAMAASAAALAAAGDAPRATASASSTAPRSVMSLAAAAVRPVPRDTPLAKRLVIDCLRLSRFPEVICLLVEMSEARLLVRLPSAACVLTKLELEDGLPKLLPLSPALPLRESNLGDLTPPDPLPVALPFVHEPGPRSKWRLPVVATSASNGTPPSSPFSMSSSACDCDRDSCCRCSCICLACWRAPNLAIRSRTDSSAEERMACASGLFLFHEGSGSEAASSSSSASSSRPNDDENDAAGLNAGECADDPCRRSRSSRPSHSSDAPGSFLKQKLRGSSLSLLTSKPDEARPRPPSVSSSTTIPKLSGGKNGDGDPDDGAEDAAADAAVLLVAAGGCPVSGAGGMTLRNVSSSLLWLMSRIDGCPESFSPTPAPRRLATAGAPPTESRCRRHRVGFAGGALSRTFASMSSHALRSPSGSTSLFSVAAEKHNPSRAVIMRLPNEQAKRAGAGARWGGGYEYPPGCHQ